MSTQLAEFYEPVRALLGDFNASVRVYADSAILSVLKLLVRGGRLPGYELTPDNLSVTPDLLDPDSWILLAYRAALVFVLPESGSSSYRTRAMSESFGDRKHVLVWMQEAIHEIESGTTMFSSWQSLAGFLAGQVSSRRELWQHLVEVKDMTQVGSLSVSAAGFPDVNVMLTFDNAS